MGTDKIEDAYFNPEWNEARHMMDELEKKICDIKQEIESPDDEDEDEDLEDLDKDKERSKPKVKCSKPLYVSDPNLPKGWTFYKNKEGKMFYRDAKQKFIKNRRNALFVMLSTECYTNEEILYIRDGLTDEGWSYSDDLPHGWMFKMYTHKIEGLDTHVLYLLSPNGVIYRSKKKIVRCARELKLSEEDLEKIQEFKSDEKGAAAGRTLKEPDESWIFDPACVPTGWRMKRYTFQSGATDKTEEVIHYLTPDNTIVRGKKHVHDWMMSHGCYNSEDFGLFHFNKVRRVGVGRPSAVNWSEWAQDKELPPDWLVRYGSYKYQRKVNYRSPMGKIFLSRFKVLRFLKSGKRDEPHTNKIKKLSASQGEEAVVKTVWEEWRNDDIPCLPKWQFSIGRKENKRKIRYKSPTGEVFQSRGPLIRYLHENGLKEKKKLQVLKKLLKTNQQKEFEDLRTNDRFIKNFTPDENYLLFLKMRYENQEDIPEYPDVMLPSGWKKKMINGVTYFKDPSENFVFNSRKLVVEHLRRSNFDLSLTFDVEGILEESGSESDLSESEESEESEEESEAEVQG